MWVGDYNGFSHINTSCSAGAATILAASAAPDFKGVIRNLHQRSRQLSVSLADTDSTTEAAYFIPTVPTAFSCSSNSPHMAQDMDRRIET